MGAESDRFCHRFLLSFARTIDRDLRRKLGFFDMHHNINAIFTYFDIFSLTGRTRGIAILLGHTGVIPE
jgi:hypothetical protein